MNIDNESAYYAGLFDGEGCISINKISNKKYKRPGFQLRISITNTNKEVLEKVLEKYGGKLYKREKPNARTYFNWIAVSRQCINVLESLEPFLIIKKEQCNIALEFQKRRKTNKTHEDWNKDFESYENIRILNARYGSKYYKST